MEFKVDCGLPLKTVIEFIAEKELNLTKEAVRYNIHNDKLDHVYVNGTYLIVMNEKAEAFTRVKSGRPKTN